MFEEHFTNKSSEFRIGRESNSKPVYSMFLYFFLRDLRNEIRMEIFVCLHLKL